MSNLQLLIFCKFIFLGIILDHEELQLKRNFYLPVYKTERVAGSRLPDYRNLLYCEPNVQTEASGKATVEFLHQRQKGKICSCATGHG